MNIEVLLTEAEIAASSPRSMEARDLPEKFFYWTPFSVHAWKELSADHKRESAGHLGDAGFESGGIDRRLSAAGFR